VKALPYPLPTEIGSFLRYQDGNLYWVKRPKQSKVVLNSVAGCLDTAGYRCVVLNARKLYVHRLIWILHNGDIPDALQIDHINRIKSDNRLENLRLVTHSGNGQNRGAKGVWYKRHGQKSWYFQRVINGCRVTKNFRTEAEALQFAADFSREG
jgi:hypothetical protein